MRVCQWCHFPQLERASPVKKMHHRLSSHSADDTCAVLVVMEAIFAVPDRWLCLAYGLPAPPFQPHISKHNCGAHTTASTGNGRDGDLRELSMPSTPPQQEDVCYSLRVAFQYVTDTVAYYCLCIDGAFSSYPVAQWTACAIAAFAPHMNPEAIREAVSAISSLPVCSHFSLRPSRSSFACSVVGTLSCPIS